METRLIRSLFTAGIDLFLSLVLHPDLTVCSSVRLGMVVPAALLHILTILKFLFLHVKNSKLADEDKRLHKTFS